MGYRGKAVEWIMERLNRTVEIVKQSRRRFRVPEGEEVRFVPAFVVLPRRRVVERTFAWVGRYRRMSKDWVSGPYMAKCQRLGGLGNCLLRMGSSTAPLPTLH